MEFEYDLFISYRHNDNRLGWVTEFVKNLQVELAATIKEKVTVYFDSNPQDGLLETHNVDKSLEGKLKCLIFVPIISKTYCDPKSFAWQHEFLSFIRLAATDGMGRDVKLSSGNVASRILPVKIHDLDREDQATIEKELGGPLRAVEFIYREPGVNRSLNPGDDRAVNLNKTDYRNQLNKVAHAIEEIRSAVYHPIGASKNTVEPARGVPDHSLNRLKKRVALYATSIIAVGLLTFSAFYFGGIGNWMKPTTDRSIAVLPFENMSNDPAQDYFGNGITEDILNHLVKISDLKVKSRTSTLQYKGTSKTIPEIGKELAVSNLLEGSVRRVGDKVRIVVQLIDARTDDHLWSETYDRDFKDVLALQSEIAIEIAKNLGARLSASEKQSIGQESSGNATAYDYFLKSKELYNQYGIGESTADLENALALVNKALQLDSGFSRAYALKGSIWLKYRLLGVSEKTWKDSAIYFSTKAIALDPKSPDGYWVRGGVLDFTGHIKERDQVVGELYKIAPNDPNVQRVYGNLLLEKGDEHGADFMVKASNAGFQANDARYYLNMARYFTLIKDNTSAEKLFTKARALSPASGDIIYASYIFYRNTGRYDKALEILKTSKNEDAFIVDAIAEIYSITGDYKTAAQYYEKYVEIEKKFKDSTQNVPFRHRLASVYQQMGRKAEADRLVNEQLQILSEMLAGKRSIGTWGNKGNIYYDRSLCYSYLGRGDEAMVDLDSGYVHGWRDLWHFHNDPLLSPIRNRDDFKRLLKRVDDYYAVFERGFAKALNQANESEQLKSLLSR